MAETGKKYGLLIVNKKRNGFIPGKQNVFGDDSDDDTGQAAVNSSLQKESLKSKIKKQTQLEIDKALTDDSSVYEYDNIYDTMQQEKRKSDVRTKQKLDSKPKYIEGMMKAAQSRKQDQERRLERKIQKERENEGGMYKDKEAFVTSAYKKKMQEMQEQEEEERKEAEIEAIMDVTKQKDMSGFYRYVLKQTAREEETAVEKNKIKSEEDKQHPEVKKEKSSESDGGVSESDTVGEKKQNQKCRSSERKKSSAEYKQLSAESSSEEDKMKKDKKSSKDKSKSRNEEGDSKSRYDVHRHHKKNKRGSRSKERHRSHGKHKRHRSPSQDGHCEHKRGRDLGEEDRNLDEKGHLNVICESGRGNEAPISKPVESTEITHLKREEIKGKAEDKSQNISDDKTSEAAVADKTVKDKYARHTTDKAIQDARSRYMARKLAHGRARPAVVAGDDDK